MDKKQIEQITENCNLPGTCDGALISETHISWVILANEFVYKIKRPVKLSYLDFSTLENRKLYCEKELELNRRLEPDMYLDILPVTSNLEITANKNGDNVIDYALKMKRMDNETEMRKLLTENKVTDFHIEKLAKKIAVFHKIAKVVKNAFRALEFHNKYADIEKQKETVKANLGEEFEKKVEESITKSFQYLNANRSFSNERVISGFQRDCHGDLNSRNIFLYDEEPVIFDCIEFDSELRQIDVLNDIVFLCVDLDFFGREDLSLEFYKKYLSYSGYKDEPKTRQLFNYYKSYRASVNAKVLLIRAEEEKLGNQEWEDVKKHIHLMHEYIDF